MIALEWVESDTISMGFSLVDAVFEFGVSGELETLRSRVSF
jgi:hypothetical protein